MGADGDVKLGVQRDDGFARIENGAHRRRRVFRVAGAFENDVAVFDDGIELIHERIAIGKVRAMIRRAACENLAQAIFGSPQHLSNEMPRDETGADNAYSQRGSIVHLSPDRPFA